MAARCVGELPHSPGSHTANSHAHPAYTSAQHTAPGPWKRAVPTPTQYVRVSMLERGESLMSIMFDMMTNGMKMQRAKQEAGGDQSKPASFDLVKAFRNREGQHLMRVTFASQLEQMEMMAAGGPMMRLWDPPGFETRGLIPQSFGPGCPVIPGIDHPV